MKVYVKPKKKTITTIIIGKEYQKLWKKNIYPFWKKYCLKNHIGLVVFFNDLISKDDLYWKKATWQRLLVAEAIKKNFPNVKYICVLDTDVIINPYAPDIFKKINKNKINLTSLRKNLPFNYKTVIRKIAFFRKKFLNKKYPLDSLLNASLETLYKSDNLKPQKDEMCVGVMVFDIRKFSKILYDWFFLYPKGIDTTTRGGCQTQLNFLIQSNKFENLLDYKFQSIWIFELASRYPFFLKYIKNTKMMFDLTINILLDNYFLHFAGSGKECDIWKYKFFYKYIDLSILRNFNKYLNKKLLGKPKKSIQK